MKNQDFESGINPLYHRQEHIAVQPGICGGKPHVAGHRIKVQHVAIWHERQGKSPDEIVAEHPGLTLADVHAALAYYYDHRQQIDTDIRTDEDFVAGLKAGSPRSRLRYTLCELLAQCDSSAPATDEDKAWLESKPVGREAV